MYEKINIPKFHFWDFKKEPVIECEYVGRQDGVGRFGNTIYRLFNLKTKKETYTWGTYAIRSILNYLPYGTKLRISYFGKHKSRKNNNKIVLGFKIEKLKKGKKEIKKSGVSTAKLKTQKKSLLH